MVDLSTLKPAKGSRRKKFRVGRGMGSKLGKTAGRGNKGQLSRTGFSQRRGFEGGQMPLHRRLPKRGFHNPFRTEYAVVNVERLAEFEKGVRVTPELLRERGIVKQAAAPVKILGDGDLKVSLTVAAHAFSKNAAEKIVQAGGKVEVLRSTS